MNSCPVGLGVASSCSEKEGPSHLLESGEDRGPPPHTSRGAAVQLAAKSSGCWDGLGRSTVAPGSRWAVRSHQGDGRPAPSPEAQPRPCRKCFPGGPEPTPARAWGGGQAAVSGGGFLPPGLEAAGFGAWPSAPQVRAPEESVLSWPSRARFSPGGGTGRPSLRALSLALGPWPWPARPSLPTSRARPGLGCQPASSVFLPRLLLPGCLPAFRSEEFAPSIYLRVPFFVFLPFFSFFSLQWGVPHRRRRLQEGREG